MTEREEQSWFEEKREQRDTIIVTLGEAFNPFPEGIQPEQDDRLPLEENAAGFSSVFYIPELSAGGHIVVTEDLDFLAKPYTHSLGKNHVAAIPLIATPVIAFDEIAGPNAALTCLLDIFGEVYCAENTPGSDVDEVAVFDTWRDDVSGKPEQPYFVHEVDLYQIKLSFFRTDDLLRED
jgi:hypothetical protein